MAETSRTPITIWSDGVRLAGDIWKPEGFTPDFSYPAVLLVHGWGGEKSHMNTAYAPIFAQQGYVVMTFDYRGWGESDGKLIRQGKRPEVGQTTFETTVREVREIVDPLDQLEDIRAAHAYLVGEPGVDPSRLGIWGTSLGGGLALQSAIELPGFKVLMIQVGSVNPRSSYESEDSPLSQQSMLIVLSQVSRGEAPPMPVQASADAALRGAPNWPRYIRYDPFAFVDRLDIPTLIIDAAEEELFNTSDNGAALYDAVKHQVDSRYEVLPGKHYDIYTGESYRKAVEFQSAWLRQYLAPSL